MLVVMLHLHMPARWLWYILRLSICVYIQVKKKNLNSLVSISKGEYRDCRKSTGDKTWDVSEAHEIGHWDSISEIMLNVL